jgi:serine/threonine protein kinase
VTENKPAMTDLSTGSTLAGHRIDAEVGRGGMGVVYRAMHLHLNQVRALKVIAPQHSADEEFRRRFVGEARNAASINHPNVIPIHDAGDADGTLYISMAYIEGEDLQELIRSQGRLEPWYAAGIIEQLARALDEAHKNGLIHRDIKPANVLIERGPRGERAYLTDFGLTKLLGSESGGWTLTGAVVGTPDYVAPEQWEGTDVDARTDVYALGCLLFEALAGRPPYPGGGLPQKLHAHLTREPPSLAELAPEVPPQFDAVVRRALAKKRADRFPSAGDLARAALAAAGGGIPTQPERIVARGEAAPVPTPAPAPPSVPTPAPEPAAPPTAQPRPRIPEPSPPPRPPAPEPAVTTPASPPITPAPPRAPAPTPRVPKAEPVRGPRASRLVLASIGAGIAVLVALAVAGVFGGGDEEPASEIVTSPAIRVGDEPVEMAVGEGAVWVWVANFGDDTVSRIDPASNEVVGSPIRVGDDPYAVAVGEGAVWVANRGDNTVSRIDP